MSGSEAEIEAQVDLLVQSGVIADADREKTRRILLARHLLLNELSFVPAHNDLDSAREACDRAIESLRTTHEHHARRFATLVPLRDDPRCREPFLRLEATLREFAMACAALAPPAGPSGSEFMRLEHEFSLAVAQLQQVLGT